jgi:4'-phosphopantetheinyl transferase EntD
MIATVIEEILPAAAVAVETREDLLDVELFPQEQAAIANAVAKRRREFVTARACARRALAQLGVAPTAIPSGERGEPCWPAGIVGSITHCAGYRACALARAGELAALGIDAEPHAPLPVGVLGAVAGPAERVALAALAQCEPAVHWDRLLFSAKESVYKVWFPLARRWLGFEQVHVTIDAADRTFTARLPPGGLEVAGLVLHGRWLVRDGLVLTAFALPAGSRIEPAAV